MKIKANPWIVLVVVCVAICTRLIPHYPNFTAIGAAALFSGAYLSRKYAWLIPIFALFISDLILNNLIYAKQFPFKYDGFVMLEPQVLWTYGVFIVIVLLGDRLIKEGKLFSMIGASLIASLLFFLVSNFAVWLGSANYPGTVSGLAACFGAGIPFFWNTLAGDLFYTAVFFGGYEMVRAYLHKRAAHTSSRQRS